MNHPCQLPSLLVFHPLVKPHSFSQPYCHLEQCLLLDLALCSLCPQFSAVAQPCPTLRDPMDRSAPGLPVHHQFPELAQLMSTESVMPSNHLILCRPLLLPSSIFTSIRVFSHESVLIRWLEYCALLCSNISLVSQNDPIKIYNRLYHPLLKPQWPPTS